MQLLGQRLPPSETPKHFRGAQTLRRIVTNFATRRNLRYGPSQPIAAPETFVSSLKSFSQILFEGPSEVGVVCTESDVSNVKEPVVGEEFATSTRST